MDNWAKILLLGFVLLLPSAALGETDMCDAGLSFHDTSGEHPVILPQWIDFFPPIGHGVYVASSSETNPKVTQKSHDSRSSELAVESKALIQFRTYSDISRWLLVRKIIYPFHSYI